MAELFSDDWYAMVLDEAAALPEVPGVSFVFAAEVAETPNGKVRSHGRVVDGKLMSFGPGKFVADSDDEVVEVTFEAKAKRLNPVLSGDVSPLLAYMRGELKVDGNYELVLDHLANQGDRAAMESCRAAVAASTEPA
ncbi:MAG: SCP2 sterol-binding domain-containing protein [Actinomycetota bacterium]